MLPPADPAIAMATPPRHIQPAPTAVPQAPLEDQSIIQVGGVSSVQQEGNESVGTDQAMDKQTEEPKPVTSTKPRRKPSKAKLAINFGGN